VPGLTRAAHDFDALAASLRDRYRVIAVDLPGRGASDWLASGADYALPTYLQALTHLLAWLDRPVQWIGTSLGGLCGMALAAMSDSPITRLVLNDIGPEIPAAALERIRAYLADAPEAFADHAALEAHLRRVHAPFGRLSDAQWAGLARHSARALPDGRLALHYDPAIAAPILATPAQDVDLWGLWSRVAQPRLVLRGAESDLLLPATVARMREGGAETHVVPECGHAPALMDAPTLARVRAFLDATC
jgi:pimeloyl-ACP methyl ester carboxylesterase